MCWDVISSGDASEHNGTARGTHFISESPGADSPQTPLLGWAEAPMGGVKMLEGV